MLDALLQTKAEIPPVDNALSRFGNPAFVTFYDKAAEVSNDRLQVDEFITTKLKTIYQLIPELLKPIVPNDSIPEVSAYLVESFGNRRRIDYGTGHEANFIAFL